MAKRFYGLKSIFVLLTLALVAGAAAAAAETSFPDPVGDTRGGPGPDITSVSLSRTSSTVTFRVRFAKAPPLGMSVKEQLVDMLVIGVDVPPRGLKRGPQGWMGADYYAGLHGTQTTAIVVKSSPTKPSQKVVARPNVKVVGRTVSFSISRAALGRPNWIEFVVAAGREASDQASGGGSDEAPSRGVFHYQLRASTG